MSASRESISKIPSTVRLSTGFDIARLKADVLQFATEEWQPHFNRSVYEGDWSGIALRVSPGAGNPLYPDPNAQLPYVDAPAMARMQYIPEVLSTLHCEVRSTRLLKLAAGSSIKHHRDYKLGLTDGEVRLHVPVLTNDQVSFYMDDARVPMKAGELWFLDFNHYHRVDNHSQEERVHLVIDCMVNDWLIDQLVLAS
jgi:hypothetical protein